MELPAMTTTNEPKFDSISGRYDFLNHLLSAGQDYHWRRAMVAEVDARGGDRILDLATGTGDSARSLVERGNTVVGVDLSLPMLQRAQQKISWSRYCLANGSAYALPLKSERFDAATCAFGIRNMPDTARALAELHRVLKPGGRIVILEFSMPRGVLRGPYRLYLRKVLPLLAGIFTRQESYEYLGESIERFPSPEAFADTIMRCGFAGCTFRPLSCGTVHLHKAFKE
jgi:demethylmenaquinone methyltransferase/2-methoxy-6-polyprenyl-1,4-benzoquinol methylase